MCSLYQSYGKRMDVDLLEDEQSLKPSVVIYACRNDSVVVGEMKGQNRVHSQGLHDYYVVCRGVGCPYCSAGYVLEKKQKG